jgi:hypothetical protein
VRWGRDLTILKAGSDWVLISLRSDVGRVDPDSLKVAIGPIARRWINDEPFFRRP